MSNGRRRAAVRPAGPLLGTALGAVLVTMLAACSAGAPSLRTATPEPSAVTSSPGARTAPDPAALAAAARTAGAVATSGEVSVTVAAVTMPVAVAPHDDGSVALTITVAARGGSDLGTASHPVTAVIAAPSGLRFAARTDRSIVVLGATGAVVGALLPVVAVDGAGARLGAELAVRGSDDTVLDVRVEPGSGGAATLVFGAPALVSARWGEREGGRSLAVVPAHWVRAGSLAAQGALWSALIAAEPDADSPTMHDQLTCHALGAPDKDAWNLEPWRPEVDSFTLVATRCNP